MRRIVYITIFITVLFALALGITYSYEDRGVEFLDFQLIGPSTLYVDINSEYVEYGVKVTKGGSDISSAASSDSSSVDMHNFGTYKVKYEVSVDGVKEYIYRTVIVIDKTSPIIKLKGEETVYLMQGERYQESGYEVVDNYDTNLEERVTVSGEVNTNKEGEYELKYRVVDHSGNEGIVTRKVIVQKPKITLENVGGNRHTVNVYNASMYQNTVTKNMWIDTGIYYEGYVQDASSTYRILLKNKDTSLEYFYDMTLSSSNYYKGEMDLTGVPNGRYSVYIIGKKKSLLANKMDDLSRLLRAKIGNKLISISYNSDGTFEIIIEDFKYAYDIVIDPGHGGDDVGATNWAIAEKEMNLKQSLYEKCRYESMGYKVYLTRDDDSYGFMLGSTRLDNLQRRALVIGYYGAVSKVTYSNHHNASLDTGDHGFEILVSNQMNAENLKVERSLYNKYKKYYKINDDSIRVYSRDYETGERYDKLSGNVYSYMDYYAVIRIPQNLFHVKTIIFEPMYISNYSDFQWYWEQNKWIEVSEIKIEEYVRYLGGIYNKDNSMCLK